MTRAPLVSVYMATYNRAHAIGRAIEGVLAQTIADWELVIADDGSTDDTRAVVESFADPRVRYFRKPHSGIPETLNFALARCRGRWLAVAGSDDRYHTRFLEQHLEALRLAGDRAVSYSDFNNVRPDGRFDNRFRAAPAERLTMLGRLVQEPLTQLASGYFVCSGRLLKTIGGYDESMPVSSDKQLLIRLLAGAESFVHVAEPLVERYLSARDGASYVYLRTAEGQAEIAGRLLETTLASFGREELAAVAGDGLRDLACWRFEVILREVVAQQLWKYGQVGSALWRLLREAAMALEPHGIYQRFWRAALLGSGQCFAFGVAGSEREARWLGELLARDGLAYVGRLSAGREQTEKRLAAADVILDCSGEGAADADGGPVWIAVPGRPDSDRAEPLAYPSDEYRRLARYQCQLSETIGASVAESSASPSNAVLLQGSETLALLARKALEQQGSRVAYRWDNGPAAPDEDVILRVGDGDLPGIASCLDLVVITSVSAEADLRKVARRAGIRCPVLGPSDWFARERAHDNGLAERYPADIREVNEIRRQRSDLEVLYRCCAPFVRSGDRVVDWHCGYGFGSTLLSEYGESVYGVEADPKARRFAAERFDSPRLEFFDPLAYWEAQRSGGLAQATFACCIDALEYLRSPLAALRDWVEALPPDGRLAVGGCQPPCGCPHVLTPLSFVDLTLFLELLGLRLLGRFVQINDALMVDGEPPSAGQRFLILGERSDGK